MDISTGASRRFAFALIALISLDAQAVPIVLEFTGTVQQVVFSNGSPDPSRPESARVGQDFVARFQIESDGLVTYDQVNGVITERWFSSFAPMGPILFSDTLAIGAQTIESAYASGTNTGNIVFTDWVRPPDCDFFPPQCFGLSDSIDIGHLSYDVSPSPGEPSGFPAGPVHTRGLSMEASALEFFSLDSDFGPLDLLTVPLPNLSLRFAEQAFECEGGGCSVSDAIFTQFAVTGVTRSIATTSVPEPGALGLFATGSFLAMLLRRRRVAPPHS